MEKYTFTKLEELRSEYLLSLFDYVKELKTLRDDFTNTSISLEQIIWICHRLSGSGQAYGFSQLSSLAREIEIKARKLEPNAKETKYETISASLDALLHECEKILSKDVEQQPYLPIFPQNKKQQGKRANVLLIDDDPAFSVYLSEQLQGQGYEVHYVANIRDLTSSVDALSPLAVLVDMDFYGDQFAGSNAVSSWREKNGQPIPVIFISAYDTYKARLSAVQAGGNYFLRKPVDVPKLLAILSKEIAIVPAQTFRVLIVDDDTDLLQLYQATLLEAGYQVYIAASAFEALEIIENMTPDLVLLDVHMPDCNGIELGKLIHQHEDFSTVPLLFMSSYGKTDVELARARLSSDDFISKPIEPWRLLMTIKPRVERGRRALTGHLYSKEDEYEVDRLTALPMLGSLMDRLGYLVAQASENETNALAKIDVRDFHTINNIYGPYVGDELLQRLTRDILEVLGSGDNLYRESGDEFYVLLTNYGSVESVLEKLRTIASLMEAERVIQSNTVMSLSVDIGVATFCNLHNEDEIISRAEIALSGAKKESTHSILLFEDSMKAAEQVRFTLVQEIQKGLEKEEFVAFYQPIIDVKTSRIVGVEALSRWEHPTKGMLSPNSFIPLMEEKNLIPMLTKQVLESSLLELEHWQKIDPNFFISLNLSIRDIETPHFIQTLKTLIENYRVKANSITLEVTETSLLADWEQARGVIRAIKDLGVQVALDDFGTGYSSLNYLNRIPAEKLKIDRSFIQAWTKTKDSRLIRAMVNLGKSLGILIVAEGIETQEELNFIQEIGCDQYQGYISAKPLKPGLVTERYLKIK